MKPAWLSYMRAILWRYPKNYQQENAAVQMAIESGVPDVVRLSYVEKKLDFDYAALSLGMSKAEADRELIGFLGTIAKNLGLPTEGNR